MVAAFTKIRGHPFRVQYERSRTATYVDKILKGAKPANLPVEQPVKFEFIVNLMAAKQIGLTIPQMCWCGRIK